MRNIDILSPAITLDKTVGENSKSIPSPIFVDSASCLVLIELVN